MTTELITYEQRNDFMPALSVPSVVARFWAKVARTGDDNACWLWTAALRTKLGYGMFHVADRKGASAHRVSWMLHNGQIPDDMFVLHRCDNPKCVNPEHLFLGTQRDNIRDALQKGRLGMQTNPMCMARAGETNGKSRLTDDKVRIIRQMRSEGCKLREIAETVGISIPVVSAVATGRTWRHVK